MVTDELRRRIEEGMGFAPTREQGEAIATFCRFASDWRPQESAAMVLRGYAGTGKTTLAAAIVKALRSLRQKVVLLAPTGRAAKVFSLYAGMNTYTIHRRIYRQKTAADLSAFNLNDNLHTDTLFIIDEASMIASWSNSTGAEFGSGNLLDDLVKYVYQGHGCRLMLVGDRAQLPPVGQDESPALSSDVLRGYGLTLYEADLHEVLRQSQASGILCNATRVRQMLMDDERALPQMRFAGFADIQTVPGDELIEALASSYSRVGLDETMVVTRSNKRANVYNQGIRRTVLDREDALCRGDQLMVVKNNYFWCKDMKELTFLANGDRCVVQRVRNVHELYGFQFAEATLQFPDYDDLELTVTVMLDTLTAEAPALTQEQQEQLYQRVMDDYADIPLKSERHQRLKSDAYYNAVQIKYGYAVTCHKAQGGQWAHVYIDQGYMTDDMLTPDYLHWLYTALTRATEKVFLVNWPKTQTEDNPA